MFSVPLHHPPRLGRTGRRRRVVVVAAAFALVVVAAEQSPAVIITGGTGRDTTAPTDPALATRWSQVGNWGGYLGTPIASNFFITAKHVGGSVGGSLSFLDGTSYATVAKFDDAASDLTLWQIAGTFDPAKIVPLYTSPSISTGASLVIFGRGTARGAEVSGAAFGGGTEPKGWLWGATDGARSWGTNQLDGLLDIPGAGLQLLYSFADDQGDTEGTLSDGDSGGPVFAQQNGVWALAGVNYAVQGPFNTVDTGFGFFAALYDTGGLYERDGNGVWVYDDPQSTAVPSAAVSTSTTARLTWIDGTITAVPEPGSIALLAAAIACWPVRSVLARVRRRAVTSAAARRTTPSRRPA